MGECCAVIFLLPPPFFFSKYARVSNRNASVPRAVVAAAPSVFLRPWFRAVDSAAELKLIGAVTLEALSSGPMFRLSASRDDCDKLAKDDADWPLIADLSPDLLLGSSDLPAAVKVVYSRDFGLSPPSCSLRSSLPRMGILRTNTARRTRLLQIGGGGEKKAKKTTTTRFRL